LHAAEGCACCCCLVGCCSPRRAEQLVAQAVVADFHPAAFEKELVQFADREEYIVRGGRERFKNLKEAMKVRPMLWFCVVGGGSRGKGAG
jgi:hypothetical protein